MAKRERLGDILIKAGLLDSAGLQNALNEQDRWGGPLGQYLVQMGLISEETLVRALSTQFKLPAVALDPPRLDHLVVKRIPQEICERNRLVCFRADDDKNFLDVAMADPSSIDAIDEVRVATRYNVRQFFAAPSAIDDAIRAVFYGDTEGALGGVIDLSPQSALRNDPHAARERANTGPKPLDPKTGRQAGNGAGSPLESIKPMKVDVDMSRADPVRIKPADPPPLPEAAPPLPGAGDVALPEPSAAKHITDEHFHISMEMPDISAIDASEANAEDLARRVKRLEAVVARNTKLLQLMLGLLAENKVATQVQLAALLKEAQ